MNKNIIKILISIIGILVLFIWYLYVSNTPKVNLDSEISIINNNIDLWEIPMDEWKVEISFEFINLWTTDITLWKAETSCMCTEWFVSDLNWDNKSSVIIMSWHWDQSNLKRIIKPNEKIKLTAIFDPNAHWPNATWPISRNIYINTNSTITKKLDFRFIWNVVKTRSVKKIEENKNVSIDKEVFSFNEKSFDFWTIKQSWWKVIHEFEFTYNWTESIKITWIPTSCACTSATINKMEFNPWEKWILTVKFNPNLHEEPKW